MADWKWETSDALTSQTWASRWWRESKVEAWFYSNGLIGGSEINDIIVEFKDLMKNQGYQHTFGQVRDLSGSGITGDSTLEGQEEEPTVYDDAITLDQKRNAIRTAGKLSEQYPSDKAARKWAKDLLKQWMGGTIDQDIFTALGASPTKAIYGGDATLTTEIEAGDYFTTNLISKCVAYAKKATPKIVGKKKSGTRNYIVVISPDQSFDLKTRDAAWSQAQRDAQMRGGKNPVFTGVEGFWDSTWISPHSRVATATTWGAGSINGATALFLGVAAGAIAYAKKKIWNEKTFDYGNKVGFAIGAIYGVTKAVFNSADNAVVAVRTFRTNN